MHSPQDAQNGGGNGVRYSQLGSSGLIVSRLAFGAMTLGEAFAPLAGPTGKEAEAMVLSALDKGINLFDTADVYHHGQSETLLGEALGKRRDEAVIATKAGMRAGPALLDAGLSARHLHRSIDASLTRLGTDRVDLFLAHCPDPLVPLEETLIALDAIVRAGKARYIGFSNWPAWMAATACEMQKANGLARFVVGQMYYSLLVRDIEHDYAPMAAHHGVGTMVWSPLSGGMLSGKYRRDGGNGRLDRMNLVPVERERGYDIVDVLRQIADARGVPVPAVAIAWLLQRPSVSSVILGFSNAAQLADNRIAADLVLTPEEITALDQISATPLPYPQGWQRDFLGREARALALAS
jgi:aryl-alcohol dehydrogenase-like predicted oxidoreductase